MAPLLVLMTERPVARNPRNIHIRELFVTPPEQVRDYISGPYKSRWGYFFKAVDALLQRHEQRFPKASRARAIEAAIQFIIPRLNGEDGLGGIYPAMANTVMMFDTLGYAPDHPDYALAWKAVRKLLVIEEDRAYCQPCFSPVWDTALAGLALAESGGTDSVEVAEACNWLKSRQVLDVRGDWMERRPAALPGGWAFQYNNPHYPDVDDTAVAGLLLGRTADPAHAAAIERARHWVLAMQSSNGGWGAFDTDNEFYYLNHIPFADHGALLDPPTADVTARCISFLAQLSVEENRIAIGRGIAYLRAQQEEDGSWFGRWGTNYIYGTWSVLTALNAAQLPKDDPAICRGVAFLLQKQREDGGWGEDCETYAGTPAGESTESLPSQTAWALLGLMAAGEVDHPAVVRGIAYLQSVQEPDGLWREAAYNAVGFPRVFYLKYHGYPRFFPLLAMARFRNLIRGNSRELVHAF
jgi:squalene-hopene/tetraprenyl-beta-curcumene cyclase